MNSKKLRRMSLIMAAFTLTTAFMLSSCSNLKVVADYDGTVDFSRYKTVSFYGWSEETDKNINRFDRERIENATRHEFEQRGYKFVEDGSDIVVSLFVVVDKKTGKTAYTNHYGTGGYYGYYGYGYGMRSSTTTIQEYEYAEGTIIIDVFDTKTKRLVWQGTGTGIVDEVPQARDRKIPVVINKIMSKYPM